MSSIADFFSGKSILITGVTGFLGKAILEKLLRALPDVRCVFVLIRQKHLLNGTIASCEDRLRDEVLASSLFDRLRRTHGKIFDELANAKIVAVSGDLTEEKLGLSKNDYSNMAAQVDVIINSAAVVSFDEQLDLSLEINVLGVDRLLEFAHTCTHTPVLMHISTCYVNSTHKGYVPEEPPVPNDVDDEIGSALQICNDIKSADNLPGNRSLREKLVDAGLELSKKRGWNDTYTYTKALGERAVVKRRGNLPTVILRPSIIESTFAEPMPGWIDGLRMGDPLIVGYARGQLKDFPGDAKSVMDLIPCDFVVNAILASIPKAAHDNNLQIYQVSTETPNPLTFQDVCNLCHDYFTRNPLTDKEGRPISVTRWRNTPVHTFKRRLQKLELVIRLGHWICTRTGLRRWQQKLSQLQTAFDRLTYYVNIFAPYTTTPSRFMNQATRSLFDELSTDDQRAFNFDVSWINWNDYIQSVHIPGLKRHVLGLEEAPLTPDVQTIPELLAHSAEQFGDKVALQVKRNGEWERFTYANVLSQSQQISARLHQSGVTKGDRVLLYSENQPEWGIAYFGAVMVGAMVVCVDRQMRDDEVIELARFTNAKTLLTSDSGAADFADRDDAPSLININELIQSFEAEPIPANVFNVSVGPDDVASIIFTTTLTADPKGVMLTHRNFLANAFGITNVLQAFPNDHLLSLLPLHHALEFTGGFLIPMSVGATVTYVENLRSRTVLQTMRETKTTCLIGVPRVFQIFHQNIQAQITDRSWPFKCLFRLLGAISKLCLKVTGRNMGRQLFTKVHEQFGGNLRIFISGGAALAPEIVDEFETMGFPICEGYGLTETAPVLTVNPLSATKAGSVGPALAGVRVLIENTDDRGAGEIVVRSPSTFVGYFENNTATDKVLHEGWFRTGDLGYLDNNGYLHLTGRLKDVIVTAAGKNVYPEEVEEIYGGLPNVAELCSLGVWDPDVMGETVHAVIVPDPSVARTSESLKEFEASVREAIQHASRKAATYQRIQKVHVLPDELPRTPVLMFDRQAIRSLILESESSENENCREPATTVGLPANTTGIERDVIDVIADVTTLPADHIHIDSHLETEAGIDSLLRVELLLALETRFRATLPETIATGLHTVRDVVDAVSTRIDSYASPSSSGEHETKPTMLWPQVLQGPSGDATSRRWLEESRSQHAMRALTRTILGSIYRRFFHLQCHGLENLPTDRAFIIAANHCSHLDTGAVLTTLGKEAKRLFILGASDYFFDRLFKGWCFHSFLNVVPFDRTTNFAEGFRLAQQVLRGDNSLLIFPEGTRSITGKMGSFKPGIGLLALELGVPIIPTLIEGTYDALPKGRTWPKRSKIQVTFAKPIEMDTYKTKRSPAESHQLYQRIAEDVHNALEQLAT